MNESILNHFRSQTKVSQFLNNVPRTKGWGSFEAKVTEWIKEQYIKLGRVKGSDRAEQADQFEVEVNPLSFSSDSMPASDVSMDGIVVHSPNPVYMVPYSPMEQPVGNFHLWIPYSNPYHVTPQVRDTLAKHDMINLIRLRSC